MTFKTIEWTGSAARIIDQTCLPGEVVYMDLTTVDQMCEAIEVLRVRGAPAIGVAAAYGVVLGAMASQGKEDRPFRQDVVRAVKQLRKTRPTAVNLFWALDRMMGVLDRGQEWGVDRIVATLLDEALHIHQEDAQRCQRIGENGADLLGEQATVMTHCNAGALATGGWGTALGVLYAARERGIKVKVFVPETRPLLQGARLTSWELSQNGIDVTLIADSSRGFVMRRYGIDCCIVGADRIASNGDAANKIGTYSLSILAQAHGVPFYVAAPLSTFDPALSCGEEIPIEERGRDEIASLCGITVAPQGVPVFNPAFDVTPADHITAIITEVGILRPPYTESIAEALAKQRV